MNEKVIKWLIAAGIRALKTSAQTAASIIAVGTVMSDIDWVMVASAAGLSAILSILTSIAGIPEIEDGKSLKAIAGGEEETHA
jgi:threonine/homoserine/homoserine lactone efflux protein